ncbi:MAG: ribosome biogenesis GTP-binding protein YihA/YsxC [Rickettsiaceae bacterium]
MANLSIKIFRQEAVFIAGSAKPEQLPKLNKPQFAFIGKSNVGKSSLINTICNRKALARVSHTPGRTQQINFFSIIDKLLLVDLPGYGFAKVSANQRSGWEQLIMHYLQHTENLKLINLLIDARRGIKDNDVQIMQLLQSFDRNFQIIFTKADKITQSEQFLAAMRKQLQEFDIECHVIMTSSRNGIGAKELQLSMLQQLS